MGCYGLAEKLKEMMWEVVVRTSRSCSSSCLRDLLWPRWAVDSMGRGRSRGDLELGGGPRPAGVCKVPAERNIINITKREL